MGLLSEPHGGWPLTNSEIVASESYADLRPVRPRRNEMCPGARRQEIEQGHLVGNVQGFKPQGPTQSIGVEQVVRPGAYVE